MKLFGLLGLAIVSLMVNLGCSEQVNTPKSESALQMEMTYTKACSDGKCPCDSPLGPIVDGGTALAYDTNQVACGATCETRSVTLVCKNGKFDRDTKPLSFSCQVSACKACTVGNNQVPHGFTTQMYNSTSVACGLSCDDNKRALVCKDGKLQGSLAGPSADGKDSLYSAASCLPQTCNCAIPGGGSMTAGGELKFYKSSTGTCDIPCDDSRNMAKRTCASVTATTYAFNGDASFSKSSCSERPTNLCGCTLPDAAKTVLGHGKSKDIFGASAPYSCNSCDNIKITAYCDSGTLYDKPSTDSTRVVLSPSQLNSHKSLSCDPSQTPDCTINNICVADKTSKTLYGKSPLTCADNPNDSMALFACANKALLQNGVAYNAGSDIYKNSWQVSAPSNSCVGCTLPWGGSVGVGSTVAMYKSSGNSSNSCGTGCKQIQMKCLADGSFDSGDSSTNTDYKNNKSNYTQTCNNTCTQEGGGAPPRFCLLPWQNSFVSADALVPMWKKKTVFYGDSCQNYFRLGRCMLSTGTFDAGFQYIYKSCTELPFQGVRIEGVSPKFVTTAGGTITLTGAGFSSGMQVSIGKNSCGSVSVSSATQLTCVAPANSSIGSYDVLVTVGTKKAVSPGGLSYYSGLCTNGPGQMIFKYTGSNQTFTVPAGCKSMTITAWGAGGGGRQIPNNMTGINVAQVGGAGGFAKGTITVNPGATYTIVVGGGGYGAYYSASHGGGYAGVFSSSTITAANAVIIAGGGGGAGDPNGCNKGGTGGEGGGATGGTHGSCSGAGGTQSAGGAGGASAKPGETLKGGSIGTATSGYAGAGTANSYTSGGAGGGGYYGGGAGSEVTGLAGAGGGGSGYLAPAVTNGQTLTGSGRMPPQTTDPKYQFGIGMGGNDPTGGTGSSTGGNGIIIINY